MTLWHSQKQILRKKLACGVHIVGGYAFTFYANDALMGAIIPCSFNVYHAAAATPLYNDEQLQ